MFCPECRYEYREGFKKCAKCEVDLVSELPQIIEIPDEEIDHELEYEYYEVLSLMNLADLSIVKSIFDAENIDYEVFGENFLAMRPLLEPVKVIVREDQIKKAKKLLDDIDLHVFALSNRT